MTINFGSAKDNDKERLMYLKSDNIQIMINDKADQVIEQLFQSLLSRLIVFIYYSINVIK